MRPHWLALLHQFVILASLTHPDPTLIACCNQFDL
jgi:hypothetical protein